MTPPLITDMDAYFASLMAEDAAWDAMMNRNEERAEVVLDDDCLDPPDDELDSYEERRG